MDLALYDAETGYYARADRRSGRAGDFFTSVDVGPLFGGLLEIQIAEMAAILGSHPPGRHPPRSNRESPLDLVEAGAGNGRLAADILRAAARDHRSLYDRIRLHLVEASAAARDAQVATLGDVADRLASSSGSLPESFEGVALANELIDAFPVHQVVMREEGLREVYVDVAGRSGTLCTREGPPSTPAIADYLWRANVTLEPGWRVEVNLRGVEWIRDLARRLRRGFVVLIDYGHEASELYSASHAGGTLATFSRHMMTGPERGGAPPWLDAPGERDITAHVDFTSVRAAAEEEGLTTLGFLDQTYFVLGLAGDRDPGDRFALKTLLMPGGLGSTHKVMMFGKDVGTPALRGCSYRMRVT